LSVEQEQADPQEFTDSESSGGESRFLRMHILNVICCYYKDHNELATLAKTAKTKFHSKLEIISHVT
jgi:hypothetical protein